MASTDAGGEAGLRALGEKDLPGCLRLSAAANWNQNEADWRLMLGIGRGWGIALADGTLAASTLVLPYNGFAWIAMVLVMPEHRKKGFATRLLRTSMSFLEKEGKVPVLDATPAGRAVYLREGFGDTWGFKRYQLRVPPEGLRPRHESVRALEPRDWARLLEMDRVAFGASREPLLRALAERLPRATLVVQRRGAISGYVLGRDGREARQLGPLVAEDSAAAKALLESALAGIEPPVYLDIADHAPTLLAWLEALGFACQRPFMRMVHGAGRAPGDERRVFLVAGPELG
jgi:GNAT superfamily N-acetyltransferase